MVEGLPLQKSGRALGSGCSKEIPSYFLHQAVVGLSTLSEIWKDWEGSRGNTKQDGCCSRKSRWSFSAGHCICISMSTPFPAGIWQIFKPHLKWIIITEIQHKPSAPVGDSNILQGKVNVNTNLSFGQCQLTEVREVSKRNSYHKLSFVSMSFLDGEKQVGKQWIKRYF